MSSVKMHASFATCIDDIFHICLYWVAAPEFVIEHNSML